MTDQQKTTDVPGVGSNDLLCPTCNYEFNTPDGLSVSEIFDYACIWGGGEVRH